MRSAGHHSNIGRIVCSPEWMIMQNLKWEGKKRINKRFFTFIKRSTTRSKANCREKKIYVSTLINLLRVSSFFKYPLHFPCSAEKDLENKVHDPK